MALAPTEILAEFESEGLLKDNIWTGKVNISEARLAIPGRTAQPTEFSVCPHGDLFHENVPWSWIDRVFAEMESCSRHGFHVLTKRAARLRDYARSRYFPRNIIVGVSCERQPEVDTRVPILQSTPAVRRSLTLYPVLGPIDISAHLAKGGIHAVYAGEEQERPADRVWFDGIIAQCSAAGIPLLISNRLVGEIR
jgi:protein gp37